MKEMQFPIGFSRIARPNNHYSYDIHGRFSSRCAFDFVEGCKTLVQPKIVPVSARHQISNNLQRFFSKERFVNDNNKTEISMKTRITNNLVASLGCNENTT